MNRGGIEVAKYLAAKIVNDVNGVKRVKNRMSIE